MGDLEMQPSSIMLVEADQELRTVLAEALNDEGYSVVAVASLAEALQQNTENAFALILADLFVGRSKYAFTPAHLLRRRAWPTPMGLLMTPPFSEEVLRGAGFACVVSKPFELTEFLTVVASVLQQPFTPVHERQAVVICRFLEALAAEDWDLVVALCTPDVLYHPPQSSSVTPARRLYGREALRAFGQAAAKRYTFVSFTALQLYARPAGLAARYTGHWTTPDGERLRLAATTLYYFTGDLIRQIGIHTPLEYWKPFMGQGEVG